MKGLLSLLVGAALMTLVGCQATTGKTAGQTMNDAGITAAVQTKLTGEKLANFARIDVDTERGMVNLSGVVPSQADKDKAGTLARGVDGVRGVNNNLQVQAN